MITRCYNQFIGRCIVIVGVLGILLVGTNTLLAGDSVSRPKVSAELYNHFDKNLRGKTVAFVPVLMGIPLTEAWAKVIKTQCDTLGMKFVLRDPHADPGAATQAISSLIIEKPDVIVVQNDNMQLLAKLIKKAEKAGIYVIQINLSSRYTSSAYVGVDWYNLGQMMAEDICKTSGTGSGKSGKVAIVQGMTTSSANIEQLQGALSVFQKHPEIKIVSNQAANWDPNKARDITATVLKQHPDLSAIYSFWGIMALGSGHAVKEAGLQDKVLVYASGGGSQTICENIETGIINRYWNYNAPLQGHDVMTAVKMVLQSGLKSGQLKITLYSPLELIIKENADNACWKLPAK